MKKCVNDEATTIKGEDLPSGNSPFIPFINFSSAIPSINEYPAKEKPNVQAIIIFVSADQSHFSSPKKVSAKEIIKDSGIYRDLSRALYPPYAFQYNLSEYPMSFFPSLIFGIHCSRTKKNKATHNDFAFDFIFKVIFFKLFFTVN